MRTQLMKCPSCNRYTMKEVCPVCSTPTLVSHPPKYSPDDKYARYRIPQAYAEK